MSKPKKVGQKSHRERKNPRANELYKEENRKQNALRLKQAWNGKDWDNR